MEKERKNTTTKQTYRFIKSDSILNDMKSDYSLSDNEYRIIHSFYLQLFSQDTQNRLKQFGWNQISLEGNRITEKLKQVLDLSKEQFVFTDKDDLSEQFQKKQLYDGQLTDWNEERFVIGKTRETNKYFKLFRHIRNCLAHCNYALRLAKGGTKMIIMQDHDEYNVTARIVLRQDTIERLIGCIVKN